MWFLEDEPSTSEVPVQRKILRILGRVSLVTLITFFVALTYFFYLYSWYALIGMNDFGKFLQTAKAMWTESPDPYAPGPHTIMEIDGFSMHFLDMNPPQFHVFLYPLIGVSNEAAATIWLLVQLAACIVGLFLIQRDLGLTSLKIRTRVGILYLIMLSTPTLAILITGQFTFVLFLLVTLAWCDFRAGRWTRGGMILGIGLGVKAFFLIFLPWFLIRRRWSAAIAFLGAGALMYGLGYIVHGQTAMVSWLRSLQAIDWLWVPMNASLPGFLDRTLRHTLSFEPVANGVAFLRPMAMTLVPLLGILTFWRIGWPRGRDLNYEMALLLTAAQLLQPLGHVYYIWLIAAPITPLVRQWLTEMRCGEAPKGRSFLLHAALLGFVLPIGLFRIFPEHAFFTMTTGSVFFWALLSLWLLLMLYPPKHLADQAVE